MILRRVMSHVRNQEWTAIGIDFLIVVLGVYLGIQLGNWNAARGDAAEYARALDRLDTEIETNFAILDELDPQLQESLRIGEHAFDVLQSCVDSESNRQVVNAGLGEIRSTYGLHLRRSALDELTTSPHLLAQQSAAARKRFADTRFFFDLMLGEAHFAEFHPLENHMENNPIIGVGATEEVSFDYFGAEFSKTRRPLFLTVPMDEACRNDQLVKSFLTWEAWQANLPVASRVVRNELNATRALLAKDSHDSSAASSSILSTVEPY